MTAQTVQNKFDIEKKAKALEHPRPVNTSYVDSLFDFSSDGDENARDKITERKTKDLLRHAYKMLERAEQDLIEKDRKIKALENIVTTDELTGLTNRRGFHENFERELDRVNRGMSQGGLLIMIDLDYFKSLNDTYGHAAGDEALKVIGEFLTNNIRPMDIAARLGGDEFILLFPNTCISKAMRRANRLDRMFNDLHFKWEGKTLNIKASIGLKEYGEGDTLHSVIHGADQMMYESKEERKTAALH